MFVQLNTSVPRRISMHDRYRLFSKVARRFTEDRKRLLKAVASESLSREIVYEGVGGLKRESWG
jgi:hypothetical protein